MNKAAVPPVPDQALCTGIIPFEESGSAPPAFFARLMIRVGTGAPARSPRTARLLHCPAKTIHHRATERSKNES